MSEFMKLCAHPPSIVFDVTHNTNISHFVDMNTICVLVFPFSFIQIAFCQNIIYRQSHTSIVAARNFNNILMGLFGNIELAKDLSIPCISRVNCLSTAQALAAPSRTFDQNNTIHAYIYIYSIIRKGTRIKENLKSNVRITQLLGLVV